MYKILVDTHTHTCSSDHAFSTIYENICFAKKRGLEMVCMTDHAPAIPDAAHIWHFSTMKELPREIEGVKLLCGVEANIIGTDGALDMTDDMLADMDVVVASIHTPCYAPRTVAEHTETWLNVIKNPFVTVLGHAGNPKYEFDIDKVVTEAKKYNKCFEINNHSFGTRAGSGEICKKIALACKKIGCKIVVSSDAHSCFAVGVFDNSLRILEEVDFPEELIMNTTAEKFENYLAELKAARTAEN